MTSPNDESCVDATTVFVRRAMAGDSEGLAAAIERMSPLLLAQARYRLGPALRSLYDPDDLVAEAWAVALPRLRELPLRDGRATPVLLRFLSTTILNQVGNLLKKHLRGEARHEPRGASELESAARAEFSADASGVVTRAIRAERQSLVRAALDELEHKDHEILILRGIEQQTNQTAALLLGLSPQAAAMRYTRALARLRALLPESVFSELDDAS